MICTAIKGFDHGGKRYSFGDTPNLTSATCKALAAKGLVSLTGLPPENPSATGGTDLPSSASPPVPVFEQTTSNESVAGDGLTEKQRRRIQRFAAES